MLIFRGVSMVLGHQPSRKPGSKISPYKTLSEFEHIYPWHKHLRLELEKGNFDKALPKKWKWCLKYTYPPMINIQ